MTMFLLGREKEQSFLFYSKNTITSQREFDGNVFLILDVDSSKGFLHTGKYFIDFVNVDLKSKSQCTIASTYNRLFYSAQPLGSNIDVVVTANRNMAREWEVFDILPLQNQLENYHEIDIISDIYFSNDNLSNVFIQIAESGLVEKNVILENVLSLIGSIGYESLSEYYKDNLDKLKNLSIVSKDIAFIESVNQFCHIENYIDYSVSEELDFIGNKDFIKHFSKNKWMVLNYHIRKLYRPTKKSCVVATAKNEGVYLLEWISYYKSLGFDAIFIYSNGNDDGSDELLQKLHNSGYIFYIKNDVDHGCSAQNKAYTHALTINKKILDYEWSLFVDLDEFIFFNKSLFSSIADFLDWHNKTNVHAIALNWMFSIPEENSDWVNHPITKRLTKFESNANGHIKTMFRPQYFFSSFPHYPLSIENNLISYVKANGNPHVASNKYNTISISDVPCNTHAGILHYFNRSIPEFIWKYSRNRGDHPNIINNESFTESVLSFLKVFMVALDTKNYVNSSAYIPNNDVMLTINDMLNDIEINDAYQEVKNRTNKRYKKINKLFWDFINKHKEGSEYANDIDAFVTRFYTEN
ncbi:MULTISPECIES: glycosyltransferase family 2 protein [unclassified Aeromonas]|uniref:glycosyltransferase family 2 protein n=1 Tax=unclassified Aeromonas TaxID=257493 RepID=UPI003527B14D